MIGTVDVVSTQALQRDPNNGFAKVHLGFILKVTDQNYAAAIPLMEQGIATRDQGVIDGRFFFQLGDALYRTGQVSKVRLSFSSIPRIF